MKFLIALLALFSFSTFALITGEKAPTFTLMGSTKEVSLADLKGKTVVLEWLNHGCPFVRKHYDTGNMQRLQKMSAEQGVVWLSIISSAKDKQGYVNQAGARADKEKYKSGAKEILLDPTGKVGKLYGAKTTPHLYIIDRVGNLVYQGAIDDKADADKDSIRSAKNYVANAIEELMDGKKITARTTTAYGCGVKY